MSNDQFKVDFGCTLDARPIADCLDNKFYVIPSYQRGFKWGPVTSQYVAQRNRYLLQPLSKP